jgi:membrane-associated phospholipid phosphatase
MPCRLFPLIIFFLLFFFSPGIDKSLCADLPPDSVSAAADTANSADDIGPGDDPADNLIDKESIGGVFNEFPVRPVKDVLVTGINDAWALIKSPAQWDSTSYFIYPSVLLATYFLVIVDEPVSNAVSGNKKYNDSKFVKAAEFYGRNITSELAAAGFTITGLVFGEEDITRLGLEIFESYYFANNIHSVVKRIFGRSRPIEEKGTTSFDPFAKRKNPLNAFPSGHAVLSFSLSTVLAGHADNTYLKLLCYAPAVLTCLSRVYQQMHWPSDVFMGAAIGYLVGNFVVNRHKNVKQDFFSVGFDPQGRVSFIFSLH